jgi:hypothetical protein
MRLTLWLRNCNHWWPGTHNDSEAIFLDGDWFVNPSFANLPRPHP